ncbi:MAG TPA: Na-translocating system protein MpsC family protein [Solirubrobacteraceae bacterium]|nr:Na-translocating system protein MpsC family protein [Solirubrobacteraceae bacterium]
MTAEAAEQAHTLSEGQLLVEISNRVVQEFRASVGKGPSRCKSYWAGRDLLVILLRGGFTVAEQTLFDAGHKQAVQDSQHALQDAMEGRLTKIIEGLTGRTVVAFLSASRQCPDLRAELFLLEPADAEGSLVDEGLG